MKPEIDEYSNQLVDLITQARLVVLASQMRFNVAQIVVQALEEQGFFLEQAEYKKGDYRESFLAKTCNYSGNEVLVTIDPDPDLDEGGKLNIESLDADQITSYELHQRNNEIFYAIKENGINVGAFQEVKRNPARNLMNTDHKIKATKKAVDALEEKDYYGRD